MYLGTTNLSAFLSVAASLPLWFLQLKRYQKSWTLDAHNVPYASLAVQLLSAAILFVLGVIVKRYLPKFTAKLQKASLPFAYLSMSTTVIVVVVGGFDLFPILHWKQIFLGLAWPVAVTLVLGLILGFCASSNPQLRCMILFIVAKGFLLPEVTLQQAMPELQYQQAVPQAFISSAASLLISALMSVAYFVYATSRSLAAEEQRPTTEEDARSKFNIDVTWSRDATELRPCVNMSEEGLPRSQPNREESWMATSALGAPMLWLY